MREHGRRADRVRPIGRAAGPLGPAVLSMLLACCAPLRPDPEAVAQDRSGTSSPLPGPAAPLPDFDGYYAGLWTPAPDGSCARLAAIPRDMLVEPSRAVSGVNYPLRGVVEPDGQVSLAYDGAVVVGRFGPDGFAGRADTGNGCSWLVSMTRQPPIGRPPGSGPSPTVIVPGEVPDAPDLPPQLEPRLERR